MNYIRQQELEDNNICDIVLELKSKGNKPILILGSYREWQKPKFCNQPNSKSIKNQLNRFKVTMKLWETLVAEDKDLIIMTDDNIDSSPNSNYNKRYNIKVLSELLFDTMTSLNITQCNKNYTRITNHQAPSCIDKIYTNVSHKINNINTVPNIDSDHSYVTAIYNVKEPLYTPKFFTKRNYQSLTKNNIEKYINYSNLDTILQSQDPNYIANTLQLELNTIYDILAPSKIVQFKINRIPYCNEEIITKINHCNNLLTTAINSKDQNDWRNFRYNKTY